MKRIAITLLVIACGGKKDDGDAACDQLSGQLRQDCKDEYRKAAKPSEASTNLNKIAKAAKRSLAESGKFPVGDARSPGNAASCCGTPDNKCAPQPDAFAKDPVWSKLEFSVDEPAIYRYEYHSTDGASFTAYAIGDADCDGKIATYTLTGKLTAKGNPMTELVPPPVGVY